MDNITGQWAHGRAAKPMTAEERKRQIMRIATSSANNQSKHEPHRRGVRTVKPSMPKMPWDEAGK